MPLTLANPTKDVDDPFADLIPSDPAPETSAVLIGGGTPAAPAYQTLNGRTTEVPKAIASTLTPDLGPFSDLVSTEQLPPIDNYEEKFGMFSDLVPRSPAPETEKAATELRDRQLEDIQRGPIDAFKKFFADYADKPFVEIAPEAIKQTLKLVHPLFPNISAGLDAAGAVMSPAAKEGLTESGAQTLTSLTTPQNVAILGSVASAPAVIQKAVSLGFSGYAANQMGAEIARASDEKDPAKFWAHVGNAATQGAFMTLAGLHGITPVKPDIPPRTPAETLPLAKEEVTTTTAAVPQDVGAAVRLAGNLYRGATVEEALTKARTETLPELSREEFIEVAQRTEPDFKMGLDAEEIRAYEQGERDAAAAATREEVGVSGESARGGAPAAEGPSGALPAPAQAEAGAAKPAAGKRIGRASPDDFATELTPVSSYIINNVGGLMSKSTAKRKGIYAKNPDLWDGAPTLKNPTHNKIYRGEGGETPDVAAQALYDDGLIRAPTVDALWEAVDKDSQTAQTVAKEARAQVADVPAQFKPSKSVQDILEQQPVETTLREPGAPPEGGAIFGAGGKRPPKAKAIGTTPMGDKNWLRIPSSMKRVGRGLFTEGTRAVLGRTKNQVGKELGKATRRQVDVEQEIFGQHDKILRDAIRSVPKGRLDAALTEVSQHVRDVENKRPAAPLQPDAQRVMDAWYEIGESTGNIARANNVQVFDPKLGKYRPMGHVKNYVPRMFRTEVETALRDPQKNVKLFNDLAQEIATHRGIPLTEAAADLRQVAGRFQSNDHLANLEMARSEQLPEIFYDYDIRNLASRYLPGFSERMAQIIAYGQRLGPRDAPQKMNLWDIARREAEDTHTQEWLNAAEDQGTAFQPKSSIVRTARRAQALGNASLLSDPTTTVVRNFLSGLSVTAERFGIGRSLRQLTAAGKELSRMDAREIGVIRDDIGNFLGAEQVGDAKLDNFIRGLQREALAKTGFSGSETFVRTHEVFVASKFARDAAMSLATKPKSARSREALAMFKRMDVDPELIVSERGEWRTGAETRKFLRTVVRESQGGYRFDQVPLWAGTTAGRFLYQYGRWAIQRAGDIFRNTIKPAIGETVEFRGQKMTRRNVLPLIRLGFLSVGLGEVYSSISSVLFGRDRKDSSFSEIAEAYSEDEATAVGMLAERMVNDIIMAGTYGLIAQPIDFIKSAKDQSRLKNPADPPSMAGVKALLTLAQKAYDQGGSLTKRDWLEAARSIVRGPKNVYDALRHRFGDTLYEAQNDVRTLRNAARRWAKVEGMDVDQGGFGDFRKSPKAPVFEALNDALLSGDVEAAKAVAAEFVAGAETKEQKKKAWQSIKTSVTGRHPFRVGPFTAEKHRTKFVEWAKKNLGEDDLEQIDRVIKTYEATAKALLKDR